MTINNQTVFDADRAHVFHSWSIQSALKPLIIKSGLGSYLWDYEGKRYLDFSSQLINTNVGHQHPKVIAGIKTQLDTLTTIAPATANHARNEAAERLLAIAGDDFAKVFFTNAGADANENAIRMARLYTGRDKVLSSYRSYHGNTGAAIAATGDTRRVPNEYSRGHVHFFSPYLYRSDFWATDEAQECERGLQHLRRVIEAEGASSIAAILLEALPGTAGVLVPPSGYMQGVRQLCDEFGIVLIMDEVMAGFGRTGKWFAHQHYNITPDLITFAKGVNSGYVPAGGVIIHQKINAYFDDKSFPGGLTYSGHPLAMASIVATLDVMAQEHMIENADTIGNGVLAQGLKALADKHTIIGEVRGMGVFWALELVKNRHSKQKLSADEMNTIKAALIERGLLPFIAENRIHVAPPCNVSTDEVAQALAIVDEVLGMACTQFINE
ncbi:aspartate aminotransferase family protein [Moraxella caviae]|uniref:Aspartate aminotransferase family protein n=2 Tax=Moraxella caviae TaxID=34060 RepID=A0A1S9ZWC1_9GAMM|nr:aspartate aminotransferase family protein [Moraxella caviae]STZ10550.1 Taurine--pyruvate aminotransferase [Moraxella caviae]VEW11351.1 Taurine--pyruvate aminotransferase [Moraxella caviae]